MKKCYSSTLPFLLPFSVLQRDFFTKLWGDNFVEKIDVPLPNYLPDIGPQHFESYMKKVARVINFQIWKITPVDMLIDCNVNFAFISLYPF